MAGPGSSLIEGRYSQRVGARRPRELTHPGTYSREFEHSAHVCQGQAFPKVRRGGHSGKFTRDRHPRMFVGTGVLGSQKRRFAYRRAQKGPRRAQRARSRAKGARKLRLRIIGKVALERQNPSPPLHQSGMTAL